MWNCKKIYYNGKSNYVKAYLGSEKVWEKQIEDLNYLCFTAEENNSTIMMSQVGTPATYTTYDLEISYDKQNWTTYTLDDNITLNNGDKVYWRGDNTVIGEGATIYKKFVMTGKISASGNVNSLLKKDISDVDLVGYCYYGLFYGCDSLTKAQIILPATTLVQSCYSTMFRDCTSLTEAPELPATTLGSMCYGYMFGGCTSLTTAPELPATTLAGSCYQNMFNGCTSLTEAPVLQATTLANNCYYGMFRDCTSLTEAPELPATTLASRCYLYMFYGCSSLNYIKAMFTTTPSDTYTKKWVYGVAATGTFVKNPEATWYVGGVNSVPIGWTIEYPGRKYVVNLKDTFDPTPEEGNATPYLICVNTNDSGFIDNEGAEITIVEQDEVYAYIFTFDKDGYLLKDDVEKINYSTGLTIETISMTSIGADISLIYNENGYFIYGVNTWSNLGLMSGFDATDGILWAEDKGEADRNIIVIE